ncbi:MAG: flagellar biosynthesis anti-sigma factor FlgM, partial [Sporomusa sp.]|nr:flagellar biosynthesis anti-sigma factor FlgM [Sporomusa sp.]
MNIKNIHNITKAYNEQTKISKNSKSQEASPNQRPDEVILSSHAQEVSQYLKTLKGV